MFKKLPLLLLPLIANCDMKNVGVLLGVNLSSQTQEVRYDNNNGSTPAIGTNPYSSKTKEHTLEYKLGYQYYFTRVYFKYSKLDLEDEAQNKFRLDGAVYELNVDYIPLLYTNATRAWNIRGIFGAGVGYNVTHLDTNTPYLLPTDVYPDEGDQVFMEYGYQIGAMVETKYNISLEVAYRYRKGDLQEYTDDKGDAGNKVSIDLITSELYVGLNYIF